MILIGSFIVFSSAIGTIIGCIFAEIITRRLLK